MWLENAEFQLTLTRTDFDTELRDLQQALPEWYHLSERAWNNLSMPDTMTFKISYQGHTVGAVELTNIRWFNRKSEIRIWLLPKARGKGLAGAALQMIMELAFNTLNFHRLEAEVYDFNEKALALMKRWGFKKEGVLREAKFYRGKYHDIIRFGLLREEFLVSNLNTKSHTVKLSE